MFAAHGTGHPLDGAPAAARPDRRRRARWDSPFKLPKEPVACALVGGGYGSAPLFGLAERLRERRCAVHMVLGAATEARLFGALEAKRSAQSVTVTTVDGSVGIKGLVTDALPGLITRNQIEVVYSVRADGHAPGRHGRRRPQPAPGARPLSRSRWRAGSASA